MWHGYTCCKNRDPFDNQAQGLSLPSLNWLWSRGLNAYGTVGALVVVCGRHDRDSIQRPSPVQVIKGLKGEGLSSQYVRQTRLGKSHSTGTVLAMPITSYDQLRRRA